MSNEMADASIARIKQRIKNTQILCGLDAMITGGIIVHLYYALFAGFVLSDAGFGVFIFVFLFAS